MLALLRQLLGTPDSKAVPSEEVKERRRRLATGALLVEVARADGHIGPEERRVKQSALETALGLSRDDALALLEEAEKHSRQATSLFELTQELDRALLTEEKTTIVELLWRVAFADAQKDPHEEQRVRQIAGLLHVPHADFIEAKIRGRAHGQGSRGPT
jgi:uncharacterized tellurite resistance protein B-like protein